MSFEKSIGSHFRKMHLKLPRNFADESVRLKRTRESGVGRESQKAHREEKRACHEGIISPNCRMVEHMREPNPGGADPGTVH
ncbi:MAG TPA: hypothetical protein VGO11_08280 [Chthoniobacteraceae bacterium]|jgi:hypothetical protein|nr:hypothetical protein [Chthoniobacteraceae bacterium]